MILIYLRPNFAFLGGSVSTCDGADDASKLQMTRFLMAAKEKAEKSLKWGFLGME